MDTEVQKSVPQQIPKKLVLYSVIGFILIIAAISAQVAFTVLKYDKVYRGVRINNISVENMTREEVISLLENNFKEKEKNTSIIIKTGNTSETIKFTDINIVYDVKAAAEKAYDVGRNGNIISMLGDILKARKNGINIEMQYTYDSKKVDSIVSNLYNKTLIYVKDPDLLIQGDKVTIISGHHGESFDKNKIYTQLTSYIDNCESGTIQTDIVKTAPNRINVDDYYNKIFKEPTNASIKVENNQAIVVPHTIGRSVEKASLISIAAELERKEDASIEIPVTFTKPAVLTEDVQSKLFKDTFYSKSTQFDTSSVNNANRGENIKLAVSKINGTILGPGQVFSFNDVVGPRTVEGGYKIAHVYQEGRVVDDVGGGICQVSTTLYNAVLYSDLPVVDRTNHMFTVGYVPFGNDAAVSYGDVDFKFKNSTNWPLKIEGKVTSDNRIIFTLIGTNETPGKSVEIKSQTIKTINFETKNIDDPSMLQGTTYVKQWGQAGCVVDTYKIIKEDGKTVSEAKIYTSYYSPLTQEVLNGTKKA